MNYNFSLCNFLSENPIKDVFIVKYFLENKNCKIVSPELADFLICDVNYHQTTDISKYPNKPKLLVMGENAYVWFGNGDITNENVKKNIIEKLSPYNYAFITNTGISIPNVKITYLPYALQAYDIMPEIDNRKSPLLMKKDKFCFFCVKNASSSWEGCVLRDKFFHALTKHKKVDSLGPHLNNIGGPIPREGFDEYIENYKFCIYFENSSSPGYITEKIIRPFVAGVVNIYWGHPSTFEYINKKAVIFVDPNNFQEAIDRILYLDKPENYEEYLQMLYEEPILNYEVFDRNRIYKACDEFLEEYKDKMDKNKIPAAIPKQYPGSENIKFVLQINNCKKYADRRKRQSETWCKDIPENIVWYHVIGDPTLKEYIYKPEEHLLIVPAADSYEGLPQKVYQSYTFAYMNFPSATHLLKTDDDAVCNVDKLMMILEENKHRNYYGGLVHHRGGKNFYGYDIVQDKSKLPKDGIDTPELDYIVGGAICISMKALQLLSTRKEIFDKFIYEDLFVAESICDQFKPEHIKLFSNDFDLQLPIFIVDRVNITVPNFFEKFAYYYQLFCKPHKYLLVFSEKEKERIEQLRTLFSNWKKFDYTFPNSTNEIDLNKKYEELKKYTGILYCSDNLFINFIELEKLLILYVSKYDQYETKNKYARFVSNQIDKLTISDKEIDFNKALTSSISGVSNSTTNVSNAENNGNNIFDFAHEGIFSQALEIGGIEGLRFCDSIFSLTTFYSSYYQSKIYAKMKDFKISLNMACRCLTMAKRENNIAKLEMIYTYIIKLCTAHSAHELALQFIQDAKTENINSIEILFEHVMCSFYTHAMPKSEIMISCMNILDTRLENYNSNFSNIVWNNMKNFVLQFPCQIKIMKNMPEISKEFTYSSLAIANATANGSANGSATANATSNTIANVSANNKNHYIGILRTHSYRVENGNYISNCTDGIIRTVNYYLTIDKDLNITSSKEIKLTDNKPYKSRVIGLEDCRYFTIESKEYILGVSYEHVEKEARTMVYYEITDQKEFKEGKIPTIMKTSNYCEKNWLPIPTPVANASASASTNTSASVNAKENPKFIYSISPTKIVELEGENKGIRTIYNQVENFDDERGSAILTYKWKEIEGYLILTHRVIGGQNRTYLNRFFFMNKDYQIIAKSNYGFFIHIGIEYCLGMVFAEDNNNLLFGVSKNDKETFVVELKLEDINNMLIDVKPGIKKDSCGYISEEE